MELVPGAEPRPVCRNRWDWRKDGVSSQMLMEIAKEFGYPSKVFHNNVLIHDNLNELDWSCKDMKPVLCWQVFNDHCFMYSSPKGHEHKRIKPAQNHPNKRLLQTGDEDDKVGFKDMPRITLDQFMKKDGKKKTPAH